MSPLPHAIKTARIVRSISMLFLLSLAVSSAHAQEYVGRYDIYNGYAALIAPKLDLTTRGYHFQAGWNQKTWLAEGFDYSYTTGYTELTFDLLLINLQLQLGQQIL